MATSLPLLEARGGATTRCTFCPKLCRPACPVSTETGRETHTPWGKMRALGEVLRGASEPTEENLDPAWACTGCGHCAELCELDTPVQDTLREARAEAFALEALPAAVRAYLDEAPARAARLESSAEALTRGEGTVGYVPGCTALVTETELTARSFAALRGLEPSLCLRGASCCGLPLLEAGDREGFRAAAERFAKEVSPLERLVVSDAGCAHALRVHYPSFGVRVPPIAHVTEFLLEHLESLPARPGPPTAVHDACKLGRGLRIFEAPRRVARAVLRVDALELESNRERGPCSGRGALLPVSKPSASEGLSRSLAEQLRAVGAVRVLSACAATRNALRREGLEALSFEQLLEP